MTAGETREFDITFNSEVAKCIVTVHMGLKISPCGNDDDLAKRAGAETFNQLVSEITGFSQKRYDAILNGKLQDQVAKKLVATNEINIPEWFKEMECQKLASVQQLDWATLDDETKAKISEVAIKNAKLTLILDAIEQAEPEVQQTPEETMKAVAEFIQSQGIQDVDGWLQENQANGGLQQVIARVKVNNILSWIVTKAKVIE